VLNNDGFNNLIRQVYGEYYIKKYQNKINALQIINLGAGYDLRPWILDFLPNTTVIEVDDDYSSFKNKIKAMKNYKLKCNKLKRITYNFNNSNYK